MFKEINHKEVIDLMNKIKKRIAEPNTLVFIMHGATKNFNAANVAYKVESFEYCHGGNTFYEIYQVLASQTTCSIPLHFVYKPREKQNRYFLDYKDEDTFSIRHECTEDHLDRPFSHTTRFIIKHIS